MQPRKQDIDAYFNELHRQYYISKSFDVFRERFSRAYPEKPEENIDNTPISRDEALKMAFYAGFKVGTNYC